MVVHPKQLPDKTLFAIDQFVLSGGRAMFFVDPHCLSDPSLENMQMGSEPDTASDINTLLNAWGMNVPALTFAGDEKTHDVHAHASRRPARTGHRLFCS